MDEGLVFGVGSQRIHVDDRMRGGGGVVEKGEAVVAMEQDGDGVHLQGGRGESVKEGLTNGQTPSRCPKKRQNHTESSYSKNYPRKGTIPSTHIGFDPSDVGSRAEDAHHLLVLLPRGVDLIEDPAEFIRIFFHSLTLNLSVSLCLSLTLTLTLSR